MVLALNLISTTKVEMTDVNNLLVIIEPDVSRSGKLYTAMSWDDTAFLVNLRIRRTGLIKKKESELLYYYRSNAILVLNFC